MLTDRSGTILTDNGIPYKRGRQRPTDETLAQWLIRGSHKPCVFAIHKSLHVNNLHVMPKDLVSRLCLPNMGRKALDL